MKKVIKSSQTKRFKSIVPNQQVKRIVYDYGESHEGLVYIPIEPHFRHKSRWWSKETEEMSILKMVDRQDCNVAEKLIDYESGYHDNYPVVSFLPMNKESAIESIHNCLFNFFGDSVEYHWVARDHKLVIPTLQNLSVYLRIESLDNVCDTFPSSPVLKLMENIYDMTNPFSPESNFYQTESIVLNLNNETLLKVLRYFQGRQAILTCSGSFEIGGLIEFVNRWKSGEALRKLEYLEVVLRFKNRFPKTEILDAIGVKRLDETKQPPSHTVPRICGWRYFDPNTDPINAHTYVVRETDNRVASISVRARSLRFGVWNETEEEFLAKANLLPSFYR
ncbi:hypothetical protein B9Z55_009037 [Caenorhabditis nigoni]|uniref:F-box associated domain-containing protein n=1 Tax=Caenorhabditis nigoni TaxID=1611254 RepID=A0A2G5UQC3_9PELO|nr:hypothetical protein B9Z55_009037 [Caenorhabditis nigoni]